MRLIDADALKAEFTGTFNETSHHNVVKAVIDIAPTIEAKPVKHGRWLQCFEDWRHQMEGDECSVCGFKIFGSPDFNYCPRCGAKMELKEVV